MRTLKRGIRSPFIDHEIKHLLRTDDVCDEVLLAAVMMSSTNEYEAQSQASKEFAKVYEASSKENSKAKQDDSVSKLVTVVFMRQTYTKCNFSTLNNLEKYIHCYRCG